MSFHLYPFTFTPVYKNYLWGGKCLSQVYPDKKPPQGRCAESWEISDREEGMSLVANGVLEGISLRELMQSNPVELVGTCCRSHDFPLLIKIIDAEKPLSVQVHPSEASALKTGGEPKNEMWYFLGKTSTTIFCGLRDGVQQLDFLNALKNKTIDQQLKLHTVCPDETIYVPAGCVHAINAGNFLLEVQQNANTTYRVYDWDRTDAEGNFRELHLKKALQTIRWDSEQLECSIIIPSTVSKCSAYSIEHLLTTPYFIIERLFLCGTQSFILTGETCHVLFVVDGKIHLQWSDGEAYYNAGMTFLIPANQKQYILTGTAKLIRSSLSSPSC